MDTKKHIAIGNQTAFSAGEPLDPWHYAVAQGFDAFEWFSDRKTDHQGRQQGWDESTLNEAELAQVLTVGKERQIQYSIHAPWQANPLYPEGMPLLQRSIEFAHHIQAELVNVHLYAEQGIVAYVDAITPMLDFAANRQVRVSIENTPLTSPETFNETFELLQQRGWDVTQVGMCLDMGHANLFAETQHDYIAYIDRLAAQVPIIHLHMHENWGDRDNHMTLFTGPAAQNDTGVRLLVERMIARGFTGAMILEQWPHPAELLIETRDRLKSMILQGQRETPASKQKSTTRAGKNDPEEPEPAEVLYSSNPLSTDITDQNTTELIGQLVQMHRLQVSWRSRLQWVSEQLADNAFVMSAENLTTFIVYLKFLSAGQLTCEEDGRHFRPNHHANAAMLAVQSLLKKTTADNAWLVRRIFPFLPSFDAAFRRREPLTRIRDIAHRNDIPQALKQEIKHRLQNKLHRCAGPEDLHTSRELLDRLQADQQAYSADFVEQFTIFHQELEDFFNASTLIERLNQIKGDADPVLKGLINAFLSRVEARQTDNTNDNLNAILIHTMPLRDALKLAYADDDSADAQSLRLLDIAVEDYCFVVTSDILNQIPQYNAKRQWHDALLAIEILLKNMSGSNIQTRQSSLIANEIQQWRSNFECNNERHLLRIQASLARVMRCSDRLTEQVLQLFTPVAIVLGSHLNIETHAVKMFVEGDLRAHLMFQLSKFVDFLQHKLDEQLANREWEIIVGGKASGNLVKVNTLADLDNQIQSQNIIVWVENIDGEEDVPAYVNAVLSQHKIPHLSHFAVRARQAALPLACYLRKQYECLDAMLSKPVSIELRQNNVHLNFQPTNNKGEYSVPAKPKRRKSRQKILTAPVDLTQNKLLLLTDVIAEWGGAKAAMLNRLYQLSQQTKQLFKVPTALVMPFGLFITQLKQNSALAKKLNEHIDQLDVVTASQFDDWYITQKKLIDQLAIPETIQQHLQQHFGENTPLAVRSSSNFEDLDNFSGAGLHESVLGVKVANIDVAIKAVWTSLWRKIAVSSRVQAKISHTSVHMAVIMQELINADYSFFIHTHDPQSHQKHGACALIEMAVGLGETIASGAQQGQPYRLRYYYDTQSVEVLQYANFDWSLQHGAGGLLNPHFIDYTDVVMSNDREFAQTLTKRIGEVAKEITALFTKPQDIEGCVVDNEIYLVQTRTQQGEIT